MRTTLHDFRHAVRLLSRQRLFTLIALTTLALGIGANSAIFAVVNAVLLRPLPYGDPSRLVLIEERFAKLAGGGITLPAPDVVEFQRESRAFEAVAGYAGVAIDLTGQGEPRRLQGLRASAALFQVLGVAPMLGRAFTPAEDRPGSGVAVISYGAWQRWFGGDPHVVGRAIALDRQPTTILGVMPRDFDFPLPGLVYGGAKDLWVPMGFTAQEMAAVTSYRYVAIARLKPGVSMGRAREDAHAVAQRIYEKWPGWARAQGTLDAQVALVVERVVQGSRNLLRLLTGAAGFVLLIACVNVANLLLGRAASREQELAIRASLGAGRARLFRQLLTESLLLSVGGGGVGLLGAMWLVSLLVHLIPSSVPRAATIDLDWHVVAFTGVVSVLAGLLFGVLPALAAAGAGESARLKNTARGATSGVRRARLRGLLVVSEVALSLVLLVGAGLLVRSLVALRAVDPGFDVEHLLTAQVTLPASGYRDRASIRGFYQRLVEDLGALPGSSAAGAATSPLLNLFGQHLFVVKDPAFPDALSSHALVLGNYFQAVGIPLRRGRLFDSGDRAGSEHALIINETLSRKYFPGQDPIGQQIKLGARQSPDPWFTVIGVVADAKNNGLANDVRPQTYEAYLQTEDPIGASMVLAVKASVEPEALTSAVRAAVARLDRELPVTNLQAARTLVEGSLAPASFQAALVGAFAGLALLLAAIGIYGVVSYAVTQRTQEIGIRMALGASRENVLKLVIGQGMKFVLAGVGLGTAAALALTRVMTGFLYGVTATDTLTFVLAPLVLCLVALAANLAPARRASGVDPLVALRYE